MDSEIHHLGQREVATLRKEIQSAFDEIKSKYGLSHLSLGTIRFDSSSFTAKISGKITNPLYESFEMEEAIYFASLHGLPPDFMGSEFLLNGSVFTITGIFASRPKYPVTASCREDGRSFKFTPQRIKELLETARVINISYEEEKSD